MLRAVHVVVTNLYEQIIVSDMSDRHSSYICTLNVI